MSKAEARPGDKRGVCKSSKEGKGTGLSDIPEGNAKQSSPVPFWKRRWAVQLIWCEPDPG